MKLSNPVAESLLLAVVILLPSAGLAEPLFSSQWRLMSSADQAAFAAGYLAGLEDAAQIAGTASSLVNESPGSCVATLADTTRLIPLPGTDPRTLAASVSTLFREPQFRETSRSQAFRTAARSSAMR